MDFARFRLATGVVLLVYEPPASRFARRVPLLLAQKGEGRFFKSNDLQ